MGCSAESCHAWLHITNVWIQCIQAEDFTANPEKQQKEGVQAWSWAVAWSIFEITNRWREHYFCFQAVLFSGCFVWMYSLFTCCVDQQMFCDCILFVPLFLPANTPWLLAGFFVNTSQGKTCQMTMTLQLKPWKSQQILLAGMCARIAFWVWFAWIHASWATGSEKTSKPTPFIHSDTTINTSLFENKSHDSPLLSSSFIPFLTPLISALTWFQRSKLT